ncbi:MAG: hypothetical protein OEW19_21925 [Acidobacteriota bacterium]|nr:hypothetical protein [Acidobacteriota bacterium]
MNHSVSANPGPRNLFDQEVRADVLVEAALPYKQAIVIAVIGLLLLLRQLVLQ